MLKLLKNVRLFDPKDQGIKDIIILKDIIYKILSPQKKYEYAFDEIYDCDGKMAFPGIIDGHVHIIGGGGEKGPCSRIGEISFDEIVLSGITTVVGLLGADGKTKSLNSLYAKAKALQLNGLTTYIYTGSYELPPLTLTDDVTNDLLLIDKVIGVGEIAIADARSSHPDTKELLEVSTKTYMGGLLSNKAGIVHLHVGDGSGKIDVLNMLLKNCDLPIDMFLPTHINRNKELFKDGIQYLKNGGKIDLTSGETIGLSIPDALEYLINIGANLDNVTISSDAHASMPQGGICNIKDLFADIKQSIIAKNIDAELVFSFVTVNAAKTLKLYPKKGVLRAYSDADILIIDKDYSINKLFAMGRLLVDKNRVIKGE